MAFIWMDALHRNWEGYDWRDGQVLARTEVGRTADKGRVTTLATDRRGSCTGVGDDSAALQRTVESTYNGGRGRQRRARVGLRQTPHHPYATPSFRCTPPPSIFRTSRSCRRVFRRAHDLVARTDLVLSCLLSAHHVNMMFEY